MSYLLSLGAWMPGRPDPETVLSGQCVTDLSQRPKCHGFSPRMLRGTSELTRMSANVGAQALAHANLERAQVPLVFGSAWGEINVALEQLDMMLTDDGHVSAVLFKNSVHNTSTGILSIAFENHAMSTAIAAGPLTVAYALLEAQMLLDDGAPLVLVVVGDESLPPSLRHIATTPPFGAAFMLSADPTPLAKARLLPMESGGGPATLPHAHPSELDAHPCRTAYSLAYHLYRGSTGTVSLGGDDPASRWTVHVAPHRPA